MNNKNSEYFILVSFKISMNRNNLKTRLNDVLLKIEGREEFDKTLATNIFDFQKV